MGKRVAIVHLLLFPVSIFPALVPAPQHVVAAQHFFESPKTDSLKKRCARFFITRYGSSNIDFVLRSCPPDIRLFVHTYIQGILKYVAAHVGENSTELQLEKLNMIILNAVNQNRSDILRLIIERLYTSEGKPVLCMLAAAGYTQSCKCLLDNRQDVNCANILGKTPLMCAAQNGKQETVDLLLQYNADTDLKTVCNKNAIELAQDNGYASIALKISEKRVERAKKKLQYFHP